MGRNKKTDDEDELNKEIGARVARLREELGRAQTTLAAELGMSAAHLNGLESGKYSICAAMIIKLARRLGVSVTTLLGSDPPADKQGEAWARLFEVLTRRDRAVLLDLASKLESWSQTFKLAVERKPAHEGRLISLEGIDGVLLHDLGERLAKHMRRRGDVTYCGYNHDSPLWRYMMQRFEQIDAADPGMSIDKTQVLERTLL